MTHVFTFRGREHRCTYEPSARHDEMFRRGNPAVDPWYIWVDGVPYQGPEFTGKEFDDLPAFERACSWVVRRRG